MKRRSVLKMTAGAGALSLSTLSGCIDNGLINMSSAPGISYEWSFSKTGLIDAVDDGTIYARIRHGSRGDLREIVALDAGTGTVEWRHKTEESTTRYALPHVQDGIYVQRCQGDQASNCNHIVALNLDGTERWTKEIDITERFVATDTMYGTTGPRSFNILAINTTSGRQRWEFQTQLYDGHPSVVGVTEDTVFVESEPKLLALDRTDGNRKWVSEIGENSFEAHISDGVAYVVTSDRIAAISDGTELWSTAFERQKNITRRGIVKSTSNRVLLSEDVEGENPAQLHGYDTATGERVWTADAGNRDVGHGEERWVRVVGDVVYLGADTLSALDANTGTELWQKTVGDESIVELTIVEEGVPVDHAVFVEGESSTLALFDPDGEQMWNQSVDNHISAHAADGYVFVVTKGGIYGLNPLDES